MRRRVRSEVQCPYRARKGFRQATYQVASKSSHIRRSRVCTVSYGARVGMQIGIEAVAHITGQEKREPP
ncbi:hypothetical protein M2140_000112 [Clostridiales Family XIII bacterium PM5-7]